MQAARRAAGAPYAPNPTSGPLNPRPQTVTPTPETVTPYTRNPCGVVQGARVSRLAMLSPTR